jgi:hypothetical protein
VASSLLAPGFIHTRFYAWKKALVQAAPKIFADHPGPSYELSERKLAELYEQLGRVMVEAIFCCANPG